VDMGPRRTAAFKWRGDTVFFSAGTKSCTWGCPEIQKVIARRVLQAVLTDLPFLGVDHEVGAPTVVQDGVDEIALVIAVCVLFSITRCRDAQVCGWGVPARPA